MEKLTLKEVLKILGVGALIVSAVAFPGLPSALVATNKLFRNSNKRKLAVILKKLSTQNLISIEEAGENMRLQITEKGKLRLLEYNFENISLKSKKRDGKWRLVIFDIPEKKKSSRDVFRRKLLQLGMVRVQDSVFASAYPCKDEVDFLSNFLLISNCVTLVVLDKFESGEELTLKDMYTLNRYSD